MDDKFSINIKIGERIYPLRIERADEERIRLAAKLIDEKVSSYKQKYSDRDVQDCLAMASIQFATKMLELESKADDTPVVDAVKEINDKIEQFLQGN
jgi:cell division protein ZapA